MLYTKTQSDFAQLDPREAYSPEYNFGEISDLQLATTETTNTDNQQEGR